MSSEKHENIPTWKMPCDWISSQLPRKSVFTFTSVSMVVNSVDNRV